MQKRMKMFEAVIDDGVTSFMVRRIARDRKDFINRYGGNGRIVRFIDRTENWPISVSAARTALEEYGFAEEAIEAVLSCLTLGYENAVDW